MKGLNKYVEEYNKAYQWSNPNALLDMVSEIQKVINFAFELEPEYSKLKPKLRLGSGSKDTKGNETLDYSEPIIDISLSRRMSRGTNSKTIRDLFDNNLISGIPVFSKKIKNTIDGKEFQVETAVVYTDNEIVLKVKTKTVKEQLLLINILERALNIYSRTILADFVNVCGIKEITTDEAKDDQKFELATIKFQMRIAEVVEYDRSFVIKGFEIFTKGEESLNSNSGHYIEEEWLENEETGEFDYFSENWQQAEK